MQARSYTLCVGFPRSRQADAVGLAAYLLGITPCGRKVGEDGMGRWRHPTRVQTQESLNPPHGVAPGSTMMTGPQLVLVHEAPPEG